MRQLVFTLPVLLSLGLVACGGSSSDSSSSTTTPTTPVSSAITANCASTSTTVSATTAGCIGNAGGVQTMVCVSASSLYMLSGTGYSATEVTTKGSKITGGKITLNGVTVSCV